MYLFLKMLSKNSHEIFQDETIPLCHTFFVGVIKDLLRYGRNTSPNLVLSNILMGSCHITLKLIKVLTSPYFQEEHANIFESHT